MGRGVREMVYSSDDILLSTPARLKELGETLSSAFPVENGDLPPSIINLMLELSRERVVDPDRVTTTRPQVEYFLVL